MSKQSLVMLVELPNGVLSLIDGAGNKHECGSPDELWCKAVAIVNDADLPQLETSRGEGPTVQQKEDRQKMDEAFGVIGQRLREVAEAEYGAPLVSAVATVVGRTTKSAGGILSKLSRKPGIRRHRRPRKR